MRQGRDLDRHHRVHSHTLPHCRPMCTMINGVLPFFYVSHGVIFIWICVFLDASTSKNKSPSFLLKKGSSDSILREFFFFLWTSWIYTISTLNIRLHGHNSLMGVLTLFLNFLYSLTTTRHLYRYYIPVPVWFACILLARTALFLLGFIVRV